MTIHRLPDAAQRAAWDRLWFALLSRPSDDEPDDERAGCDDDDANDDRPVSLHPPVQLRPDDRGVGVA